jgi:hypothetical protein
MDKKGLVGLVIVLGVLLVVGGIWFVLQMNEEAEKECIKVQTSCCPCSMGGSEKCVLASEVEEYEDVLSECEEGLLCAAFYACEIEFCEYVDGECVGQ